LAQIMTTKELAKYLRLHEITILKNATKGIIPGIMDLRLTKNQRQELFLIPGKSNCLRGKSRRRRHMLQDLM
jgi:hypothetical protein